MFKQIFTLVFLNSLLYSVAFEPVTTSIAIGSAVALSALLAGYDTLTCTIYECCVDKWLPFNLTSLSQSLENDLHGQHLVRDSVVKTLRGHLKEKSPKKALALSFHGWTGGGKNLVSRQIGNALFRKGYDSSFVHLFVAPHHFPHESRVDIYQASDLYVFGVFSNEVSKDNVVCSVDFAMTCTFRPRIKDQLKSWIKGNVSSCARSLFIFDEMDKMPHGLIDVIKPFLEHYDHIDGVDYRKSIFIFLSNTAGESINEKTLEHWREGKMREAIQYKDMEEIIHLAAFNEKGGFWHASLLKHNLISAFVPFLPLEKRHVKKCIKDDMKRKGHLINEEAVDKIAEEMHYFPQDLKLFSKSGCKKVSEKVDMYFEY